ncbi:MAG: ankyrin repeat domain-containing protein [Spirochaetia bacterium]|jgi:hypothetical protein
MKKVLVLMCVILMGIAMGAFADIPKALDKVPVYPGAAMDPAATQDQKEVGLSAVKESAAQYAQKRKDHQAFAKEYFETINEEFAAYSVEAWPEEVFNWYATQLGAAKDSSENWMSDVLPQTSACACSPVVYDVTPLTQSEIADLTKTRDINDPENRLIGRWDGEWVKKILQSRPKTPEGWFWGGTFRWIYRQDRAVTVWLTVSFGAPDNWRAGHNLVMIDGIGKKLSKKLSLVLSVKTERQHPGWEFETGNLDDAGLAKLQALYATPPTEKDLGAPVYPGAEFDYDTLIENPGAIGVLYPYTTTDPAEKVTAWYEKATGKKRLQTNSGVGIIIKGDMKAAVISVSIRSFSGMGTNETMITVTNQTKGTGSRKLSDADEAKLAMLQKSPPTEKDLGAPIYPGAQLEYEQLRSLMLSGSMKPGQELYPYSVVAPYEKVVAFYKDKTGQSPMEMVEGTAGFFLKRAADQPSSQVRTLQIVKGDLGTTSIMFARTTVQMSGQSGSSATAPEQPTQAAAAAQPAQPVQSQPAAATPQAAPVAKSVLDLAKTASPEAIVAAIKDGANVNEADTSGNTPLMYAAMSNPNPKVISALVAAGAAVDAQNSTGMTALMLAAKSTKKSAVVQALIDAHANMKLKDASGKTAFDYATGNGSLRFTSQMAALGLGRF